MAPAQRITLLQRLVGELEREAANLPDDILARQRTHLRLAQTYLELGRDDDASDIARRILDRIDDPRFAREITRLIPFLESAESGEHLLALSERLLVHAPDNTELALLHARLMRECGKSRETEFRFLQRALSLIPDQPAILITLVRCATGRARVPAIEAEAEAYARRLVEVRPAPAHWILYGRLLLLQGKESEALAALNNIGPRLDPAALGPLGDVLSVLCAACNETYTTAVRADPGALRQVLEQSHQRLRAFLDSHETVTAEELDAAARKLMPMQALLVELSRIADVGETIGDHFGTFDLTPFRVLGQYLPDHLLLILESALSDRVLARPVKSASVIRRLADTYTAFLLSLGKVMRAKTELERLAAAGFGPQTAAASRKAAMFAAFEAAGAARCEGDPTLHRMAGWSAWAERLATRKLERDQGSQSAYTVVSAGGETRHGSYTQQPVQVEIALARSVRLRESELMIGPDGLLLRPNPMHGHYPPRLAAVAASTPQSVAMRASAAALTISEPVLILALNNCSRLASYGHWMIFILPRINLAIEAGLLARRKLLMPAELTSWMRDTLALIGLRDDQVILYPRHKEILVEDAEIMSPIDYPGGGLVRKLKMRMRQAAGVRQYGTTPRHLFLARKEQIRRMMLDGDKVYALAQKLGFTVISPEMFSIAEQVQMFAGASAVAGPGGSAFANAIFCEEGTRVLCLKGEEKVSPLVLDLAASNRLDFRWLIGPSVAPLVRHMHPLDAPFRLDLAELERQLAWAIAPRHATTP